jgi:hypothetical protein
MPNEVGPCHEKTRYPELSMPISEKVCKIMLQNYNTCVCALNGQNPFLDLDFPPLYIEKLRRFNDHDKCS